MNGTIVISSLTIFNALSPDVGTYTCHAENIIGIDRSSGILTVNGKCIYYFLCFCLSMFINLFFICISVCLYNVDLFYLHINNFQMLLKSLNRLEEKQNTLEKEKILHLDVWE